MPTIRTSGRSIRLAVSAAVVVVAAALTSGCGAIASIITDGLDGETSVYTLAVGDCIVEKSIAEASDDEAVSVSDVPVVDCAEPHDYEVFALETIGEDGDEYPGTDAVLAEADADCLSHYTEYTGLDWDTSTLEFNYLYPTEQSWAMGDQGVTCIVYDPALDEQVGSLKG